MRKLLYLIMITVFLSGSLTMAGRLENVTEKIDAQGIEKLVVEADFAAGEFRINAADIDEAAIIDVTYDTRRVEYIADYSVKRGTGYLFLESNIRRKHDIDTDENVWDITLSTKYPTSLEFDIGACEAEFDLGGIPLQELDLDIGAASGLIEFSTPNPIRLRDMRIDAGASSLEMVSIGNANFEYFNFDGGVGSFELDFRGEYKGESTINVDIGLGSVDIVLPKDVPVRVETDGDSWLSSVEFHRDNLDEVDDDVYESPGFEDADERIILELSVGLGSADIYFK